MKLADIGVNLTDRRLREDRQAVLERARRAGVVLQLVTGTDAESSREALALARLEFDLYSTAGVHPHVARDFTADTLSSLRELAMDARVRAIGETGLDFNRDFSPRPQQEKAFREQLALAAELDMPVFLHQRDAHDRFLPILRDYRDHLPAAVVHCFTGPREELYDYLDLDCHIGITGWLCDERRGGELRRCVRDLPLNRLLVETDSPWLLPRNLPDKPPVRGRNEPSLLPWIVRDLARCMESDEEAVAKASFANTLAFLGLEETDRKPA